MKVRGARVALTVIVALAAVGCGRGDGTEEVSTVREIDLLQGVEAAGTARMAVTLSWDFDDDALSGLTAGWSVEAVTEGVVDFTTGDSELTGTFTSETDWPADAVDEPVVPRPALSEERTVDGRSYVRGWAEGDEPGPWLAIPGGASGVGPAGIVTAVGPTEFLDRLREVATTVTEVGPDEVRGDAATRYRATVDPEEFDDDAPLWVPEGVGEMTIDVWVDGDDRLRRAESDTFTVELWDFGTPVEVVAPEDVFDDDDELATSFPEVTGEWAAVSSGEVDGQAWTVFAAPAEHDGVATTCRTLELEGTGLPDLGAFGMELPIPNHDGHLATCGSGLLSTRLLHLRGRARGPGPGVAGVPGRWGRGPRAGGLAPVLGGARRHRGRRCGPGGGARRRWRRRRHRRPDRRHDRGAARRRRGPLPGRRPRLGPVRGRRPGRPRPRRPRARRPR